MRQNHLESRMLGNLHVRFGVGAGAKFHGLHHHLRMERFKIVVQ